MRARLTADAVSDLWGIKAFFADRNVGAGEHILERIAKVIAGLRTFPWLGHTGVVAGTLERTVAKTPYVIVYRIDTSELVILRVYHTSQDRARGGD
jgi:plasmid stabilization system protein ParE